ncbi:hypothetical protein ANO11243_082990 [Dothideomycetidae sp. 11243]|nr:hypothetical protein ANO11243_082990 [fungal sp. No.11243]
MAAVREDDTVSLSSVPDSDIEAGDSDSDFDNDMSHSITSPQALDPAASAKHREAQAESSRARQMARQQYQIPSPLPTQMSQTQQQPQRGIATEQDDVPPPTYSEALRQQPRNDVAVADTLNSPAHARLHSVTEEQNNTPAETPQPELAADSQIPSEPPVQDGNEGHTPGMDTADMAQNYGAISFHSHAHGRGHRDEHGHHRQSSNAHADTSDETSDPSADELEERRRRRGSDRKRRRGCCGARGRRNRDRKNPKWMRNTNRDEVRRRRIKKFLIICLILCPIVFFLDVWSDAWVKKRLENKKPKDDYENVPTQPDNPSKVLPDDPASHRDSFCPSSVWTHYVHQAFNPNDDVVLYEDLNHPRFVGTVRIVEAPESQELNVQASVAYAFNPKFRISNVGFIFAADALRLAKPTFDPDPYYDNSLQCADVDIILSIKKNTFISNLGVSTAHLGIAIDDNVFYNSTSDSGIYIQNSTLLETTHGKISAHYLSSRDTTIHTQSGRVEGTFALYHHLSITTASGAIKVIIDPKPAPKDDPTEPAELGIRSYSGHIEAQMPTSGNIPNRNYKTVVKTSSGAIKGAFIFGEQGEFSSHSGRLEADLLPYVFSYSSSSKIPDVPEPTFTPPPAPSFTPPSAPTFKPPTPPSMPTWAPNGLLLNDEDVSTTNRDHYFHQVLRTDMDSSATHLDILDPYYPHSSKPLLTLASAHNSMSGAIDVSYPKNWTGKIWADSISGRIDVEGSGLERISQRSWYGIGEKGTWRRKKETSHGIEMSDSAINIHTVSSRIKLSFRA